MDFGARLKLHIFLHWFYLSAAEFAVFFLAFSFVSSFPIPTIPAVSVLLNAYMSKHVF